MLLNKTFPSFLPFLWLDREIAQWVQQVGVNPMTYHTMSRHVEMQKTFGVKREIYLTRHNTFSLSYIDIRNIFMGRKNQANRNGLISSQQHINSMWVFTPVAPPVFCLSVCVTSFILVSALKHQISIISSRHQNNSEHDNNDVNSPRFP